ncbi:MAG TPA: HlyD family secretion protein [Candidatus Binatia bacterium]|nr:HlyD family secretion protein [Candidatus Binatia bacterium]
MARRRSMLGAGALVLLALLVVAGRYFLWTLTHVGTDDAYVDAHVVNVTPRVAGAVVAVPVDDNHVVEAGSVLVQLDPTDFRVRLDQAAAALERARQTVDEEVAAVAAARADQALAAAQLEQALLELDRVSRLRRQNVVSADDFDRARIAVDVARARHDSVARALERAQATLGPAGPGGAYDRAIVREAESARRRAELDLDYATLTAPLRGVVTRRAVEVGQRVEAGQPLMALVPFDLYVVANFKETQLARVRVGQPAELRVDLYPGAVFHGRVDSIASGTGAVFSLLPPENASGNWVKVVQRVPVKIVLDDPPAARPLRVGLSVEAAVDVSDTSGALLGALGQGARAAAR